MTFRTALAAERTPQKVREVRDRVFPREHLTDIRKSLAALPFAALQNTFEITCPDQIGPGFNGFQRAGMLLEGALAPQRTAWLVRMLDLRLGPDTSTRMFPFLNSPGTRDHDLSYGIQSWRESFFYELTSFDNKCKSVLRHDLNNMMGVLMGWPEMKMMAFEKSDVPEENDPTLKHWKDLKARVEAFHGGILASSGDISFPQFLSNMIKKAKGLEVPISEIERSKYPENEDSGISYVRSSYDRMVGTLNVFNGSEIEELLVLAGQPKSAVEVFRERTERQPVLSEIYRRQYRLIIELGGTNFLPLWKLALSVFGSGDPKFTIDGSARTLLSFLERQSDLPESGI